MGMITRVRGRIHSITKLNPQYQEEKIAQTVCLLSVVLLMPYMGNSGLMGMPVLLAFCSWLTNYSCVAAPLLVSAKEKYNPVSIQASVHLLQFLDTLKKLCVIVSRPILKCLRVIYSPLDRAERAFFGMSNLFTLMNQITFFLIVDRVLNPVNETTKTQSHVTSLYSLMFYNVISYCVCYIKELIEKEDWSPYVHITKSSNVKHLAMTTTKVVLEFTKALTFIITVIFMLLIFGLEQKLENYQPTPNYTVITWIFYMATEKVFVDLFKSLIQYLQLDIFESLEMLYAPCILQVFTVAVSALFVVPLVFFGKYKLVLMALYFNIYLRCKHLHMNALKDLWEQQKVLVPFRHATSEELEEFDDICAVCLSPMKLARITPCHHLFHANCLRQCLQNSTACPICKQEYKMLC